MDEHDEHDEHDNHAAGPGRGEGSVKRVDDPPTLPPFASDGPRPATIHGFPAVDVFGDGGLGDLFDVPKLGARAESTPISKAAPPSLPPLASRTGLKAPTGPVPIIPQGSATQSPVAPPPAAKGPAVREPTTGPQQDDLGGDGLDADRESAKPASLPSAMSLIEKIRAAKRKEAELADAESTGESLGESTSGPKPDAKPEPKPDAKPEPKPKSESRPIAPGGSKAEPRPAPPQPPGGRPPPPKPPASTVAAEPRPAPPKPPASTAASEPRPAPPKPPASTVAAEPKPAIAKPQAPTPAAESDKPEEIASDKPWLEPVPLLSLDRRHEAQASISPASTSPTAEAPRTDTPPTADISPSPTPTPPVMASESSEPPAAETSSSRMQVPARSPEPESEDDGERTIAVFTKPLGRVGNPLPPPPTTKPVLAPPPPTSATVEHQAKVGAPYEPPALVLERSGDAAASEPSASEEAHSPDHDTETARPRPALPIPGGRRPPLDPMNPIMAARLASATNEADADAVPEPIPTQDTASLVNGLADEIIREHQPVPAANSVANAGAIELEPTPERQPANERRRKLALYFLGVAAVLSLIVALLPSKDDASETEPTPEVADAPEPEPSDPTLLAEAQPSEPVPVPEDPVPASDTETGAETDAGAPPEEPPPVASDKPKPKSTKPEPKPEPTSKPEPKPEPKPQPTSPTPGGPDDKRSADELYNAAKSAYNSGRAAEAYKLAYASWRKKDKSKTAELMTLAACKLKDKAKAKTSLDKVTAVRRSAIKKDCQALGLSL